MRPPGASADAVAHVQVADANEGAAARLTADAANATALVLEGEVALPGVHIPVAPEIHGPVLERLAELGLAFAERVESAA